MIGNAGLNPVDVRAKEAITRLRAFHRIVAEHSGRHFRTLVLNDGAVAYRDLSMRTNAVTHDFLSRSFALFQAVVASETRNGWPGPRMVLSAGLRGRSWVESANAPDSEFPIQNLPLGVFSRDGKDSRPGLAIGTQVLDLRALSESALPAGLVALVTAPNLDPLLAAGTDAIGELRALIEKGALTSMLECRMHLPSSVRSFTDFYAGVFHARTSGVLMKSDPPLPRSYGNMPLAYNGRASSVRISGEDVRRPRGQRLVQGRPEFGVSRWLDFELEVGAVIAGSNALGDPVPIGEAARRIAGFCLLNDWSARDIQLWEMPPLGAFNSKAFSTTVSPWIITRQAMAPYRTALMDRIPDQAPVAPYLIEDGDQASGGSPWLWKPIC